MGKAWKKGEAEPNAWNVQLRDENPNRNGPPGLYGSAHGIQPPSPGTPVYYDNILIN